MRTGATRRARLFRRQRVIVEVPPEDGAEDAESERDDPGTIEVHVHLHRGERSKRSRSRRRGPPVMSGALFDWQWYQNRLLNQPRPPVRGRWSLAKPCHACDATVPWIARHCPRCGAPGSRGRVVRLVGALLGLGSLALVLALSTHVLGKSVAQRVVSGPLGEWTDYDEDDDVALVEANPSSTNYSLSAAAAMGGTSGNATVTR